MSTGLILITGSTKGGGFEKVSRAFELTGHSSGVYHLAWRNDSARVATVSKGKRNYYFKISPLDGAQIEQRPISFYVVQF